MPGVPNAFEACVFTFGIAQAGGAGKVLAEWVTEGQTEWDMWSCDPRRFTAFAAAPDYCVAKGMEIYGHEYAIQLPAPCLAGRPRPQAVADPRPHRGARRPVQRLQWLGARHLVRASRATTFRKRRRRPSAATGRGSSASARNAWPCATPPAFSTCPASRASACRARARATGWPSLITGVVPKPGRIGLGYFADDKGRIVTEMSIMALAEDFFFLITAAVAEWHDFEWLQKHLPQDTEMTLENVTERFTCQILSGPKSREILAEVTDADLSLPWLSHQSVPDRRPLAAAGARLLRRRARLGTPHQGRGHRRDLRRGLGRRPEARAEAVRHVRAGFAAAGKRLPRLEAAICRPTTRSCRAGSSASSNGTSRHFSGKAALQNEKQQGVKKRFVTLVVEDPGDCDAPYMSTLWHDGGIVGETTSGGWGHRVDKSIALGMLRADLAVAGTEVEVEIFGERFAAIVQKDEPLWDPRNERLKRMTMHQSRRPVRAQHGPSNPESKAQCLSLPPASPASCLPARTAGRCISPPGPASRPARTSSCCRSATMISTRRRETVEACVTAVRGGHHHYTQLPGIPALREAMAKVSTRCTGVADERRRGDRHAGRPVGALRGGAGRARSGRPCGRGCALLCHLPRHVPRRGRRLHRRRGARPRTASSRAPQRSRRR